MTVATFETPIAAELARVKLHGEDIPALVADSMTVGIQPFYGGAIGVRVQVPADMAEEAVALLRGEQFPIFMDPLRDKAKTENPYSETDNSEDEDNDSDKDTDKDYPENSDSVITTHSGFIFDKKRFAVQIGVFIVVVYILFRLLFY
ncbi:MAG: DUF2007 domain-containing protein [Deltaproteobacteria bacterium]|nr:DUF2007 domain-containing protein [Deltaproteobacteria bacterium]